MKITNDAKKRLENHVARIVDDVDVYEGNRKEFTRELTSHFYDASMARAQSRSSKIIEKADVDAVLADSEDPGEMAHAYMDMHTSPLQRANLTHRSIALAIDLVLFIVMMATVTVLIGMGLYIVFPDQVEFHSSSPGFTGVMLFGSISNGYTGLVIGPGHDVYGIMTKTGTTAGFFYLTLGTIGMITTIVIYMFVIEGRFGYTPGKWLMGLRVLRENGTKIGYQESIVRNLLKLVGIFTGLILIEPVIMMVFFRKTRQSSGDRLAGTMVVRKTTTTKEVN